MEIIFELIFGLIFETVLGIVGEVLVELGFNSVAERFSDRTSKRFITGAAYAVFGIILGASSLLLFPKVAFANRVIPVIYFILSPFIAGMALCVVNWVIRRDIEQVRWFQLAKFLYGVIFVLAFSSTRAILG